MVETLPLNKIGKMLELAFCFSREAHDQRCSQHSFGELFTDLIEQLVIYILLPGSVHGFQHFRMAVLQRQIQVRQNVGDLSISS
ncbi:MAG: Uncharacterised protein [Prochlorococcus marinus str. MIT 9215]|nr:MAG: Uncharacterised protein [Prochlorococcus marinus str. MIT 9215]